MSFLKFKKDMSKQPGPSCSKLRTSNFSCSNTDGSFTTAVSKSLFLSPYNKTHIAEDLG